MERYGNMGDFNEAVEERRILDERQQRRQSSRGGGSGENSSGASGGVRTPDAGAARRFMFTSDEGVGSRPGSRAGFRRPGEVEGIRSPGSGRIEELKRREVQTPRGALHSQPSRSSKASTPVPSVFTPSALIRSGSGHPFSSPVNGKLDESTSSKPPLSIEQLNKLQARVLRAKLLEYPTAGSLEDEYEIERFRASEGGGDQGRAGMWEGNSSGVQGQMGRVMDQTSGGVEIQVLPTLDGRGRLYDIGTGKDNGQTQPGDRRRKTEKVNQSPTRRSSLMIR